MRPSPRQERAAFLAVAALSTLAQAQIHLPLTHAGPPASAHQRRGDTALASLENWATYASYTVNVTVGTPPQTIEVGLSLGTWDSWVPGNRIGLDSTYDSDASSTFEDKYESKGWMTASYADGSSASGHWASDTWGIGNASVDNILFGVASSVVGTEKGILALGYPVLNSIVTNEDFLGSLAAAGEISTPAFSIWADDAQGLTGNILFGAIDSARYHGELQRVNMPDYYAIYLDTLNATNHNNGDNVEELVRHEEPIKMSVSPTDSASFFPEDIAFRIWEIANATYEPETGWARISCDAGTKNDITFSFMLGGKYGPTIDVSLDDLVLSRKVYPLASQWRDGDGNWCMFGVQNTTRTGLYSLGKPMWTRTYLVFDAFNREMAVAPVIYGTDSSDVVPFDQYGGYIPSSIAACTISEWACNNAVSGGSSDSHNRSTSPLIVITIIVPIVIGVAVLIGVAGSIWCCKRQRLCCFARNHNRDAAIARHAAAAGQSGPDGYVSDATLASGGPPMTEKYAGAPSAFAPVYNTAPQFAPYGAPTLAPPQQACMQPPERSVSPLSDYTPPPTPPPTGPLPPPPAAAPPMTTAAEVAEPHTAQAPEPHPSPKGKGRALD
jgi:hypothetical protein